MSGLTDERLAELEQQHQPFEFTRPCTRNGYGTIPWVICNWCGERVEWPCPVPELVAEIRRLRTEHEATPSPGLIKIGPGTYQSKRSVAEIEAALPAAPASGSQGRGGNHE